MKIRSDFVSNSSSSSFILADSPIWNICNITKQDIFDALVDCYGKKDYDDFVKKYENDPDCKSLKPFYVYDMQDALDRKEALKCWLDVLKGWTASNCHLEGKDTLAFGSHEDYYIKLIEGIEQCFNLCICNAGNEKEIKSLKRFVYTEKTQKNGIHGKYVSVPQFIKDTILAARKNLGIIDNAYVLKSRYSRFFVHFLDNEAFHGKEMNIAGKYEKKHEIWSYDIAKGRKDWNPSKKEIDAHNKWAKEQNAQIKNSIYESDSYEGERVFEILYNWLVKNGKIVPNDKNILNCYSRDKNGDLCTYNGKSFTWHDLANECITACWHEG